MSLWEIICIIGVALLLFGPKQLPSLLKDIASIIRQIKSYIAQAHTQVDDILNTATLAENEQKAKAADKLYQQQDDAHGR